MPPDTTATRVSKGAKAPRRPIGQKGIKTLPKQPKQRRNRPGVVALREIRKLQKGTDLLCKKLSFVRIVREIAADYKSDVRFQPKTLLALQEATEEYIVDLMKCGNMCAIHAKRVTLMAKDLALAKILSNK